MSHDVADQAILPQNAWDDKMVEVSDVVETQKDNYSPSVYLASQYYNNATKKRGAYFIPYKTAVLPFHIWNSLVEKAGFKMADAPNTWDAFWDFFKPMAGQVARCRHAQRLFDGAAVHHDGARRRQQHVQPFLDREWR